MKLAAEDRNAARPMGWLARGRTVRPIRVQPIETRSQRQAIGAGCVLVALLASASLALGQTAPAGPPAPRSRLGVNIGTVRDWTAMFMFIDVMKSSRRFGP